MWHDAGEEHAQVVTWGNGESGALGHGKELGDVSAPKIVELFHSINVCSLAAGWSHTAFVTGTCNKDLLFLLFLGHVGLAHRKASNYSSSIDA